MQNYNDIPNTGTIGGMVTNINANFQLTKEMLERLEITKDKSVGLFSTLASLQATYPSPEVGDWALVGDSTPFAVYKCTTAGTWSATGGTYDAGTIDLSDYVTQDDFAELAADVAGGCARISATGAATDLISARFYGVIPNHTYRLTFQRTSVDMTGVTYTSAGYARLQIVLRDKSNAKIGSDLVFLGCDTKANALPPFYDFVMPNNTALDCIQVAFRAAEGWVQWYQLEDITDHAYLPNISLVGRGNDIVYSAFYKGLKGGRKYRVLIKSPNIDMSGVTNTNSRLIIYMVNLANIVVDTTTQVARWNKADTLPDYYDIDVPDDGVDYALHYCMRATAGAEQILEIIDMTDFGEGGGGVGLFNYVTLIGNGQTPVLTEPYRGLKQGRKYRFVIKNTDIDMTGCSGTGYARLSILLREKDHIDLPYSEDTTRIDAYRVNIGTALPDTADITVPDDGKEYYVQLFMRAAVGAEQMFMAFDATDLGEGGGEEGGVPDPMTVEGSNVRTTLYNSGYTAKALTSGHTYRVWLTPPDYGTDTIDPEPSAVMDLFNIIIAPEHDGVMPPDSGDSSWEGRTNILKVLYEDKPTEPYYDFTIPDDGRKWHVRFAGRLNGGETLTFSFEDITDSGDNESGSGDTSMLSLIQGNIGQDGKAVEATDFVHTSPIAGGRGFYILLNEGYEIYNIHLFKSDGTIAGYSYFPLGLDRPPSSVYKRESGLRCYYSNLSMPQGYYMVLVITKVTTSGGTRSDISTADDAVAEFTYMDSSHLHPLPWTPTPWVGTQAQYDALTSAQKATLDCIVVDGNTTVPYIPSDKARMLKDRYKSITNAVWTPKAKVPVAGATDGNHWDDYLYLEGQTRIGVCYSEVAQFSKYVGQHVSLYTFLTAARNKRSVLYTEDIKKRTSKYGYTYCDSNWLSTLIAPFYGTVCSGLTGYVLCMKNIKVAATYHPTRSDKVPNLTLVPNGDSTNVLPMDIIAYSSHVAMVTDVYLDDDGKRKFIVWTEMTRPFAISSPMTCEQFDKRLADKRASEDVYILRPDSYDSITAPMEDPVQKDFLDMPKELTNSSEICTHLGDKPCVGLNDILYLNCFRGTNKYTSCVIEKSTDHGETWSSFSTIDISSLTADTLYPNDGEDWVMVDLCAAKTYGLYRAHLTGSGATSGYTYWEVLDTTAAMVTNAQTGVSTITFAHDYGAPYLIRNERSLNGYMQYNNEVKELTAIEIASGSTTVTWTQDDTKGNVVKVFWRGDYGVAVKELSFT